MYIICSGEWSNWSDIFVEICLLNSGGVKHFFSIRHRKRPLLSNHEIIRFAPESVSPYLWDFASNLVGPICSWSHLAFRLTLCPKRREYFSWLIECSRWRVSIYFMWIAHNSSIGRLFFVAAWRLQSLQRLSYVSGSLHKSPIVNEGNQEMDWKFMSSGAKNSAINSLCWE